MVNQGEPKSWLCTENNFGQQMETKFLTAMGKLGVPEVPNDFRKNDPRKDKTPAIARATPEEDADGIDFWLYIPRRDTWYPIDLTTNNNPDKINIKKDRERKLGIKILKLYPKTIENASLGGEVYLGRISQAVLSLFSNKDK